MQTQLTVLNNGLHVVSKKDETTGMFNIGVWCRCGSRFETPAQNGIAHFCEHMTFKGTTTRSELEINEQIADLGGKSNAWTDMDTTAFSIEVLNEDREAAIELLADILLNSTFTEANIDSERQVIFQEMYEDENDSDDCFNDAFSQLVYGSQPLGRDILGSRETLGKIGKPELDAWRQRCYCGENLILSAAGNFEHEELVRLAEKYFGKLPRGQKAVRLPQRYIGGFRHIRPEESEVKFELGFDLLAGHPYYKREAKYLALQILGGEEVSRLNTEARIKRSLVYDISTSVVDETDVGFVGITAAAQAENINRILDVVIAEIKKLAAEPVSSRELERAKRQMIVALTKKAEDNEDSIEVSAEQLLNFGRLRSTEEQISRINAVSTDDVLAAAAAIFATTPVTVTNRSKQNCVKKAPLPRGFFSLSCSALSRTSLSWIAGSSPAMTEEKKSTGMTIFFLLSSSDKRSAFRGSLDSPVKPGNDREKKRTRE